MNRDFPTWSLVCSAWILRQWGSGVLCVRQRDCNMVSNSRSYPSMALLSVALLAPQSNTTQ